MLGKLSDQESGWARPRPGELAKAADEIREVDEEAAQADAGRLVEIARLLHPMQSEDLSFSSSTAFGAAWATPQRQHHAVLPWAAQLGGITKRSDKCNGRVPAERGGL